MSKHSPDEITRLLKEWGGGNPAALDELLPMVYKELRRLAASHLRRERSDHTLQPTALVHEAYMRLVGQSEAQWQNRSQFFAVVAQTMRRVLVDHAKSHRRAKRGGSARKLSLDEAMILSEEKAADLVALDDALTALSNIYPRKGKVVELRYFGGMSVEEVAEVLDVSRNTVMRDWSLAKAWLYQEIKRSDL